MADKAKHAHGSRAKLNEAIANKVVDAFDVLFLSGENENPAMGWLDKDGNPIILSPADEVAKLETQVEAAIATKADTAEVDAKIDEAVANTMTSANAYTDEKLEAALGEYLAKKYEISHKPEGTLVNYRDKEIRIMCPVDTKWALQNSGEGADANLYYIGFKAFAPDTAVSFKEDLQKTITDETMYYFKGNDFAGVDENGRKFSIVWLPVAKYDGSAWTYYGANSAGEHYIGWYYSVEFYDDSGTVIASDSIRINLSNEQCHSSIEPYYVGEITKEIDTKIEEKISEIETTYQIIEF